MYLNGEDNLFAFSGTMVADVRCIVRGFVRYSTFEEDSRRHLTDLEGNFRRIFLDPVVRNVPQLLVAAVRRATYRTRFARLSGGYMALVPDRSEIGDNVCELRGSSTSIVLRRNLQSSPSIELSANNPTDGTSSVTHRMIGPCYVHGVMGGEMFGQIFESFIITWLI